MRRPTFDRWIRKEILRIAGTSSFNMRRFAAYAQKDSPRLAEPLLFYAYATNCEERLLSFVWRDDLRDSYEAALKVLEGKDLADIAQLERAAGVLPAEYRKFLNSYRIAYRKPENERESKQLRWERSRVLQLEKGISTAEIYCALGLNAGNTNAFMKHGDFDKLSLENATRIMKYLYSH